MPINFPNSPANGQTYVYDSVTYTYEDPPGVWTHENLTDVISTVTISDGVPVNPVEGQLWYNSEDNLFMIYIDSFWVQIAHRILGGGTDADTLEGQNLAYVLDLTNATGTLDNSNLSSDVTLEGNTFNIASSLVKLTASAKLPNVDGSGLTNLTGANAGSYGAASLVPVITVDANGRITDISQVTVSGGGGGGGLGDAYAQMTDGSTTSTALGADVFKFRTADNKLDIAVGSNDPTHGDNVLFTIQEGNIDHDNLSGFVANEHISHTAVAINGGAGLTGGGTIDATRAISLNIDGLTADGSPDSGSDYVATYDASAGNHKKVLLSNIGETDHGNLTGLSDDDHTLYALADGTRWTTTPTANRVPVSNGSGNLVVSSVSDTELGYLSGVTSAIQTQIDSKANTSHTHATADVTSGTFADGRIAESNVTQHEAAIDHDALTNFVANEHINHSSVSIATAANSGLAGGGNLTSTRNLSLNIFGLSSLTGYPNTDHQALIYDVTGGTHYRTTLTELLDHNRLENLGDDDHTQYSLADGTRWTTTPTANRVPVSNGSGNLVVSAITDTELGHLDGVSSNIQTQLNTKYDTDTDVNHNSTTNYVANEHIDHSATNINAGTGLSGGGSIDSSRTINLDFNSLTTENSIDGAADAITFYDDSAGAYRKTVIDNLGLGGGGGLSNAFVSMTDGTTTASASGGDTFKLRTANSLLSLSVTSNDPTHGDNVLFTVNEGSINHNNLTNYSANRHIDHSAVSITAGTGLTGGGDITASRNLSLDVDGLITTTPDSADSIAIYDASLAAIRKTTLTNLGTTHSHAASSITSGTFANARIASGNVTQHVASINHNSLLNYVANQHIDHSTVSISTGTGLTGGGTIAANRTINLDINALTADASPVGSTDFVLTYDASAGNHKKVLLDNLPGGGGGVTDHGALTGLGDDDHTLYALADGTRWTTTPTIDRAVISNGSGNLVVSSVTSTELGYLSGVTSAIQTQIDGKAATSHTHATGDITSGTFADGRIAESNVTQHETAINHDNLTSFVANEHIDHTSVTLTAGVGLSGGGDISSNRTFNLDIIGLTTENSPDGAADSIVFYDDSAGAYRKTVIDNLGLGGGGGLSNAYVSMTDGTVTASASGGDTFKLRSANSLLTVAVQSNDPTHGDNALFTINEGSIDHGSITGLTDDDHTLYSLADGTRWTTTPTINRAVISDGSGNLVVSSVTSTELGHLSGVTSAIQTQLNSKFDSDGDIDHGGINGLGDDDHTQYSLANGTRWTATPTANRVPISNGSSNLVVSAVTDTELGYLSGVTSAIQTQIDSKAATSHTHATGDITSGTFADARIAESNITQHVAAIDHGSIAGLVDDDHTQYSLANGTRWTTTPTINRVPISDGSGNLVVSSVTSTELGHLSGVTSAVQTQIDTKFDASSDVDHDATTNFVANEHIDHTSVTLTAGEGLTGGGDISSSRTFDLDVNGLTADATPDGAADYVVTYDASAAGHKKVLLDDLPGGGGGVTDHGALTGLGDDDHTLYALADGTRWTTTNTANRVPISDGSGNLVVSSVTDTELGYLSGVTSNVQTQLDDIQLLTETSEKTSSYELVLADAGKVVLMNGSTLTLTVPTNANAAFAIGTVVNVYNVNATDVTIAGDGGVTVRNAGTVGQYGEISLRKRATDEWVLAGATT